jgi:crossover junction endodeoxyribonuclease RuvC
VFERVELHVEPDVAAKRNCQDGFIMAQVAHIGDQHDIGGELLRMLFDVALQRAAGLFVALNDKFDADRWAAAVGREGCEVNGNAALVVGRASTIDSAVEMAGRERIGMPALVEGCRLDVVVRVHEHGRVPGLGCDVGDDGWGSARDVLESCCNARRIEGANKRRGHVVRGGAVEAFEGDRRYGDPVFELLQHCWEHFAYARLDVVVVHVLNGRCALGRRRGDAELSGCLRRLSNMRSSRVMGIDPGLTRCGVGIVSGSIGRPLTMVGVDVVRTPADMDLALRLLQLEARLDDLVRQHRPDEMSVERVFSQANVRTVMGTAQASAVAMLVAARHGVPVTLHTPSEVKAAVTGSGRADKAQVTHMVTRVLSLKQAPKPADAADALALAICQIWRGTQQNRLAEAVAAQRAKTSGAKAVS